MCWTCTPHIFQPTMSVRNIYGTRITMRQYALMISGFLPSADARYAQTESRWGSDFSEIGQLADIQIRIELCAILMLQWLVSKDLLVRDGFTGLYQSEIFLNTKADYDFTQASRVRKQIRCTSRHMTSHFLSHNIYSKTKEIDLQDRSMGLGVWGENFPAGQLWLILDNDGDFGLSSIIQETAGVIENNFAK